MSLNDKRPKIILSSSLTTGRRFVKQQNLDGKPVVNFSLYSLDTLVREKLISVKPDYKLISNDECAYILLSLIRNNDYRLKKYVTSFGAASTLLDVFNDYRYSSNDTFKNLIDADYKKLLKDYCDELNNRHSVDIIEALKLLKGNKQKEDCYILTDLYLRPLEREVVESMFDYIDELVDEPNGYQIDTVFSCYGQYDEVANVLEYVEKKDIPTGDVEVLYVGSIYENFIKGLCSSRDVPCVMKSLHARSSNYVSFLYDILSYIKNDYKYELLENILSNQALDGVYLYEFYKTLSYPKYVVGDSRERSLEFIEAYKNENSVQHFIELFKELLDITENGFSYEKLLGFAKKYIKAKQEVATFGNLVYGLSNLVNLETDPDRKVNLVQDRLESLTYSGDDVDDAIIFSPISKSFTLRKYVFVLGINQTTLVGSDVENAFIKDVDAYKGELGKDRDIHISAYQRNGKVNNLKYYLSHSNSTIFLSYSSYDKINLKDMTEGVRLLTNDTIKPVEVNQYRALDNPARFKNNLTKNNQEVEPQYDNGEMGSQEPVEEDIKIVEDKKKEFKLSPSATSNIINCPFMFYYEKILKIPSIEYPELDEATWLEANKKGDMFHRIMELYFSNYINQPVVFNDSNFNKAFATALEEAIANSPINNQHIYQEEKNEVERVSRTYIQKLVNDNAFDVYRVLDNEFELSRLDYRYPKNNNLILHGNVDRVDGYLAGDVLHLRIVDYKSGREKKKETNKYCQHVFYSYVIKEGLKQALAKGECLFGLSYKDVVVDLFVYDFTFVGSVLEYQPFEFDENSPDYKKVFKAIDGVVLPYLSGGKNIIDEMNKVYYADPQSDKDRCKYCKYTKECIKKYEWGC